MTQTQRERSIGYMEIQLGRIEKRIEQSVESLAKASADYDIRRASESLNRELGFYQGYTKLLAQYRAA